MKSFLAAVIGPCFLSLALAASSQAQPADIIVETDVPVPMRDGTILRANVMRPAEGGPYPVLVMRTPYGKKTGYAALVRAGYIVVSQDARGRYASDGVYESISAIDVHDGVDGYDTVEWAARLPNSTGEVGTFGTSYNAFLQWRLAPLDPPALHAMAAFSIPARHTDIEGPNYLRIGRRLRWWHSTISPDLRLRSDGPPPHTSAEAGKVWETGEGERLLHSFPRSELGESVFGSGLESVQDYFREPHVDNWQLDQRVRTITVPNLNVCGWYDHCNGSIDLHTAITRRGGSVTAREQSRLLIGPWSHSGLGKRKQLDIDFGPEAQVDLDTLQIRWFDHWIKGIDNGVDREPQVRIFVMGANRWRDEHQWPLERAVPTAMYLASGGQANTPAGDGRLSRDRSLSEAADRYSYDPEDPVPTLWSANFFTCPADQRVLAERQDILVYQSPPLEEAIEVTGYPEIVLYAASSAKDTDFFARLIDVAPDGRALDVAQGMVRARYRHSLETSELLVPGSVTRLAIRMRPTSNVFLPGHRIRLDVTSSDFPNYDVNHNTAADQNYDAEMAVAEQTVHHSAEYPSRLILPVIPAGSSATAKR